MCARKLRGNIVHIIVDALLDSLHHCLGTVAAFLAVALNLLNPLQIDDGYHSDQQVYKWRHLGHSSVQPFIKQNIRILINLFPGSKSTRFLPPFFSLFF